MNERTQKKTQKKTNPIIILSYINNITISSTKGGIKKKSKIQKIKYYYQLIKWK